MPTSIPPTNTTSGTAYVLNGHLPLDGTIDLTGLANPQKVWFKYTLGANDFGLAIEVLGETLVGSNGFRPLIKFYHVDPLGTPYQSGAGDSGPIEAFIEDTVAVPQTGDIYISVENSYVGAYAPSAITSIYVQLNINQEVPIGSPIINNDADGFPMTILNSDGEPSQLRSFPAGESAAILENGISLWSEHTSLTTFHLYDENLEWISDVTWNRGHLRGPISSNREDTFWAATRNVIPAKIVDISDAGVVGTELSPSNLGTYTIGNFYHVAPSLVDDDIIYVYGSFYNGATPSADLYGISRFHISTEEQDNVFIDADDPDYDFGGFYGNEFLVFPDDSLLLMFRGDTDSKVRLYSALGTLIRTFVISNANVNRLAFDGITYTSFWTWSFSMDNFDSIFVKFRISDGAELENFTIGTTTEGFAYNTATDPTVNLFGVPESCPLITTTTVLPPYGTPEEPPEPTETAVGGIYYINTARDPVTGLGELKHDRYYGPVLKKIPNPTIRTALIGE